MTDGGGTCWRCGGGLLAVDYGRSASCDRCGQDSRVCKNCLFYSPGLHNDCHEPQAERVQDKERANFCDYFKPGQGAQGGKAVRDQGSLRQAAESFFKK